MFGPAAFVASAHIWRRGKVVAYCFLPDCRWCRRDRRNWWALWKRKGPLGGAGD